MDKDLTHHPRWAELEPLACRIHDAIVCCGTEDEQEGVYDVYQKQAVRWPCPACTAVTEVLLDALPDTQGLDLSYAELPETLYQAVRDVYRYRTKEATLRLREEALQAGRTLYPDIVVEHGEQLAAYRAFHHAVRQITSEFGQVVRNFYGGLFDDKFEGAAVVTSER